VVRREFLASGSLLLASSPTGPALSQEARTPMVRIAEIEIDPARLEAYRAALREEIEASIRLEPGVLALQAVYEKDNPTRVRILEVYADIDAYNAHIATPHFQKYKTGTEDMVRSLNMIEAVPILLGAKLATCKAR